MVFKCKLIVNRVRKSACELYILAALATVASCGHATSSTSVKTAPSPSHAPAPYGHASESYGSYGHESYPDAHPTYKFSYSVHDPKTHDVKEQEEYRDGHHVKGFYSLYEADGSKRVVHYIDNGHGFEATVHKEGGKHPVSAPVYHSPSPAPSYHPAPVYEKYE
ncbi:cuticle protein 8 [Bemisia tabaci]|uniref:cuticle protein 8 n=1 Tax=Bemisia tabaci TaxID=7038 RepID=UPI003B281647